MLRAGLDFGIVYDNRTKLLRPTFICLNLSSLFHTSRRFRLRIKLCLFIHTLSRVRWWQQSNENSQHLARHIESRALNHIFDLLLHTFSVIRLDSLLFLLLTFKIYVFLIPHSLSSHTSAKRDSLEWNCVLFVRSTIIVIWWTQTLRMKTFISRPPRSPATSSECEKRTTEEFHTTRTERQNEHGKTVKKELKRIIICESHQITHDMSRDLWEDLSSTWNFMKFFSTSSSFTLSLISQSFFKIQMCRYSNESASIIPEIIHAR